MADFCRDNNFHSAEPPALQARTRLMGILIAAVLTSVAMPSAFAAPAPGRDLIDAGKEIVWDSHGTCELNIADKTIDCNKVRITQGELSIEAAKATATSLDFQNSKWSFKGDVHIRLPEGHLDSQSATVVFRDKQIATAVITGAPATFEQRLKEKSETVRGHAGSIQYDVGKGTVKFDNQALLDYGRNEITGSTLVYNILDEKVIFNADQPEGGNVNIKIRPTPGAAHDAAAPPSTEGGKSPSDSEPSP
jgi:lipopolysaccharide transport protein LptA